MKRILLVCSIAAMIAAYPASCGWSGEKTQTPSSELDQQLLEGLEDEATKDVDQAAEETKHSQRDEQHARDKPAPGSLDRQLLDGLEDSETAGNDDPLRQIGQKMHRAEKLLAGKNLEQKVQTLQKEIVSDLDRMLEKARRQMRQSSSSSTREQLARRDQAAQPNAQTPAGGGKPSESNSPARDSEARLQERSPERPDSRKTRELVQELWGHLPERDRQQVINSTMENFIPKYELLIKEYFKRLTDAKRDH